MLNSSILYEHVPFNDPSASFVLHRKCQIDRSHGIPAHWHESIELLYLYEGECDVVIDANRLHMTQREVICINAEQIHSISTTGEAAYSSLIISPTFLEENGFSKTTVLNTRIDYRDDPLVADQIRLANIEGKKHQPYWRCAQKAAVTLLLCYLYRLHSVSTPEKGVFSRAKTSIVKSSLDYIREHYLEDISTRDIANALGVTVNHLCACFKETTGVSVKKYINGMRCHDAQMMLYSGDYTVTEVSVRCGFNNMPYFAKVYRRMIGVLPSETLSNGKQEASRRQ